MPTSGRTANPIATLFPARLESNSSLHGELRPARFLPRLRGLLYAPIVPLPNPVNRAAGPAALSDRRLVLLSQPLKSLQCLIETRLHLVNPFQ